MVLGMSKLDQQSLTPKCINAHLEVCIKIWIRYCELKYERSFPVFKHYGIYCWSMLKVCCLKSTFGLKKNVKSSVQKPKLVHFAIEWDTRSCWDFNVSQTYYNTIFDEICFNSLWTHSKRYYRSKEQGALTRHCMNTTFLSFYLTSVLYSLSVD